MLRWNNRSGTVPVARRRNRVGFTANVGQDSGWLPRINIDSPKADCAFRLKGRA